ncbi:MAG: hypothetical protein ACXQT2_00185 [Methanotrichaceae archaeon]
MGSVEAWKIIEQKRKYWYKTLSDDATWSILAQSYNVFDWLSFFSDITLSDTLWSSLVSWLLLGIPFTDLEPWNLLWRVELPAPEEFLRGVMIRLERVSLRDLVQEVAPELAQAVEQPSLFLEEEYAVGVVETGLEKAVYGGTRFDYSYYDPPAVREFFRATVYAFMKKGRTLETAKHDIEEAARILNIHPEVARTLFNRLSAISSIKERALTWDYGWWDFTYWSEEGSEGKVTYINYELQPQTTPYEDLVDYQAGGFWDDSPWDYFYWTEEYPSSVHPFRVEGYNVARLYDVVYANFRSRIATTPLAVANYQTRREREKWTESERLETFALPVSQRMHLERLVESVVRSREPDVDACKLRLYKSAVLQLFGDLSSPHRWGVGMQRTMSEDELRRWWIERWVDLGLDRDTLETLYSYLRKRVDTYTSVRQRERLRFLRKRLVGVK